MGLCCENTNIVVSSEMSMQDICYIQQSELDKAKSYLLHQSEQPPTLTKDNKIEETILRYSQ